MSAPPEKRERTLYEISSSFFAALVVLFALIGIAVTAFGDEGADSIAFAICVLFLALGIGRLYLGLRRGGES